MLEALFMWLRLKLRIVECATSDELDTLHGQLEAQREYTRNLEERLRFRVDQLDSTCKEMLVKLSAFEDWRREASRIPKRALSNDPVYQALPDKLRETVDWERLGYHKEE